MKKIIAYTSSVLLVSALAAVLFVAATPAALAQFGGAMFNTDPSDFPTVQVYNYTRYGVTNTRWQRSISDVRPGDIVAVAIYYHNSGGATASNTTTFLSPQSGGTVTSLTFTGGVRADNASAANGSASIFINSAQAVTYIANSVRWYPNQSVSNPTPLLSSQNGSELFGSGLRIGDITPGWSSQGTVVAHFQVGSQSTGQAPVITNFSASPTNVNYGNSSTLSWSTQNADTCTASGAWSGNKAISGSQSTGSLYNNQTYTLSCSNQYGSDTRTVTVTVQTQQQNPTITSFYASPNSVNSANSSTLYWSSTNADYCTASGAWSGTKGTSGQQSTGSLYNTQTYTLTCYSNSGGSDTRTVTVTVQTQQQNPTITSFYASPTFVNSGNSSTLFWATQNADYCTASGAWSGNKATSGQQSTGSLYNTQTYTLTCYSNSGGSDTRTVTVTTNGQQQNPTITSFYASPSNVDNGNSSTLYWSSTNADYCTASGAWNGSRSTNGSVSTNTLYNTQTYTLTCYGNSGGSDTRTVTVSVNQNQNQQPQITNFTANPSFINSGNSSVLSWSTINANYCSAGNGWSGTKGTNGSETTNALYSTQTYTLTCYGNSGGSDTRTVTVTVNVGGYGLIPVITNFSANPSFVTSGNSSILSWSTQNANFCSAYGDWYGTKSNFGSESTGAIYNTRTYTLTCTNSVGSDTRTVTVSAGANQQVPIVTTNAATGVTDSGAVLNGFVSQSPANSSVAAWFEYGLTASLGLSTSQQNLGSINSQAFARQITGLTPNTTYYFQAVAQNGAGIGRGAILSFRTGSGSVLGAVTPAPTDTTFARASIDKQVENITRPNKSGSLTEAEVGDTLRYTITVRNTGTRTLTNLAVTDKLADTLNFQSASDGGYYDSAKRQVNWTIPTLAINEVKVLTLMVVVGTPSVGNTATADNGQIAATASNGSSVTIVSSVAGTDTSAANTEKEGDKNAASVAGAFLPSSLSGWLLLLLLVVIIAVLIYRALRSDRSTPNRSTTT